MPIHPTAVVDRSAEIDPTAEIGAYAIVEPHVRIGAHTRLWPHAYISEGTTLGESVQVHPYAVLGHIPQDLKWKPVPTYLTVGDGTIVREHVAVHRGTTAGSTTVIGKRCFLICTAHVGHNCTVGDDAIIAGTVAGHVDIGPRAFVSGGVVVHQFVRVGELAMIGGGGRISVDLPPFMTALERNRVTGPNVVGLRRAGVTSEERFELRQCYTLIYREGLTFPQALERVAALVKTPAGQRLLAFLQAPSKRGFAAGARHGVKAAQIEE